MKLKYVMLMALAIVVMNVSPVCGDLVSHFAMEEGSGTSTADEVSGNDPANFTGAGTPAWTNEGAISSSSYAVDFSGSGVLTVTPGTTPGTYISTNSPFSVSFWMKSTHALSGGDFEGLAYLKTDSSNSSYDKFAIAMSSHASYRGIAFGTRNDVNFLPLHTSDVTTDDLTDGQWHNIIVTYNGLGSLTAANFALYIDGISKSLTNCGNFQIPAVSLLGGKANGLYEYSGFMDEFALFDVEMNGWQAASIAAGLDFTSAMTAPSITNGDMEDNTLDNSGGQDYDTVPTAWLRDQDGSTNWAWTIGDTRAGVTADEDPDFCWAVLQGPGARIGQTLGTVTGLTEAIDVAYNLSQRYGGLALDHKISLIASSNTTYIGGDVLATLTITTEDLSVGNTVRAFKKRMTPSGTTSQTNLWLVFEGLLGGTAALLVDDIAVATPIHTNLTAYFRLDEGSGTNTADDVKLNDPANFTGAGTPAWTNEGAISSSSYAVDFSGSGVLTVTPGTTPGTYISTNSPFSVSFWMKSTHALSGGDFEGLAYLKTDSSNSSYDKFAIAMSSHASYRGIAFGTRNDVNFLPLHTSDVTTDDLTDGQWHNIIVTYNGLGSLTAANFALYIDGISKSLTNCGNFQIPAVSLLGGKANGLYEYSGFMDEFALFNMELEAPHIRALADGADAVTAADAKPQGTVIIIK